MKVNKRVLRIMEVYGLTSSQFADLIEVRRSSISHITSGRNKASLDFLVKVKSKFPDINTDWLFLGEGEMKKKENNSDEAEKNSTPINTKQEKTKVLKEGKQTQLEFNEEPEVANNQTKLTKPKQVLLLNKNGTFELYTPA